MLILKFQIGSQISIVDRQIIRIYITDNYKANELWESRRAIMASV